MMKNLLVFQVVTFYIIQEQTSQGILRMNIDNMKERHYRDAFETTLAQLTMRRRLDKNFTIHECQKHLETEYVNQGNNWIGRGSFQDIVHAATIAAYEAFIAEWQRVIE